MIRGWENFYVIVGSSAAALTGLQFVVIALTNERHVRDAGAIEAFATPTIVHFCSVLAISAIVSMPDHSTLSLSTCLSLLGIAGIVYAVRTALAARRQTGYKPVLEDWLWHVGFPIASYVTLFAAGILSAAHPVSALYVVAASALALLFIGIHNAWDAAVYIASQG